MEKNQISELYLAVEITKMEFKNSNTIKNIRIELWGIYEYSTEGYTSYRFKVPSYEDLDKNDQRVELQNEFLQCDLHGDFRGVDLLDLVTGLFLPNSIKTYSCEQFDITHHMKSQLRKMKLKKLIS